MSAKDNGGPAFAAMTDICGQEGMSLRDYFAAAALQGMIASNAHPQSVGYSLDCNPQVARLAYEYADAMIAERLK